MKDIEDLQASCKNRVDEAITGIDQTRDSKWTESIAVGSERCIEATKSMLGIKAKGRKIIGREKVMNCGRLLHLMEAILPLKMAI